MEANTEQQAEVQTEEKEQVVVEAEKKVEVKSMSDAVKNKPRLEPFARPDVSKLYVAIKAEIEKLRPIPADWHLRQGYVLRDPKLLAEFVLAFFRFHEFKLGYAMTDPFPSNIPNARRYRNMQRQSESEKGNGFIAFLTNYLEQAKQDIRRIHHCVLGLFGQQQQEQLYCESMINIDINDASKIRQAATFKVECERLSLMFSDVCSGMYMTKQVPDPRFPNDPSRKVVETGVMQMPFYAFLHKSLNDFDKITLVQYIRAYQEAVYYAVIGLQIQSVFEIIKETRRETLTEKKKNSEDMSLLFPVAYRKVYIRFTEVFSPFISDENSIRLNFHVRHALTSIHSELAVEFSSIIEHNAPGNEFLRYDKAIQDEKELEKMKKQKVPRTHFYPTDYLSLIEKLVETMNIRHSDKFRNELWKKYESKHPQPVEEQDTQTLVEDHDEEDEEEEIYTDAKDDE
jgi:hypothetical protein